MEKEIILSMQHIDKSFPGVKALDDITLKLYRGEILGLCGENGAGKSTLLKILSGIYTADAGTIVFDNQIQNFLTPRSAIRAGISVIHQELSYLNELTVAENIFLGRLPMKNGFVNWKKLFADAAALLGKYDIQIDPKARMSTLPLESKQLVELIKAISVHARIIVMDEPTSSLGLDDVKLLMRIVRDVAADNISFIFVSHRLEEVFEISDRVVVIRDGRTVAEFQGPDYVPLDVISAMVGRQLKQLYNKDTIAPGVEVLRVSGLSNEKIQNISFNVHAGEIVGLYGMAGAGQDEILNALFGMMPKTKGSVVFNGEEVQIAAPRDAIRHKIGHVTAERKFNGLILGHSVERNLVLADYGRLSRGPFISYAKEKAVGERWIGRLGVKTPSANALVGSLSGGNQQKVVIGKWLQIAPKLLLLNEPTRGVDVGAKQEIFDIIQQQCREGMAVLMISSDMLEMLNMADRIYTVFEGRLTAEFNGKDATQVKLMMASIDRYKENEEYAEN